MLARSTLALAILGLLTACPNVGAPRTPVKPRASVTAAVVPSSDATTGLALKAHDVTGRVLVPAQLISDAGGSIISNHGGGVVSNNGGTIISDNAAGVVSQVPYALLAIESKPLAGLAVTLADAAGKPVVGVPTATTDALGRFALTSPAKDGVYSLTVPLEAEDGRQGAMRAFVTVTNGRAGADISLATTFIASAVSRDGPPASLDAAALGRATAATELQLVATDPPLLFDPVALAARMAALEAQIAEIRTDLAAINARLDDLAHQVDALKSPTPPPQALPTPPAVTVSFLAGGADPDAVDGTGAEARFNGVAGLSMTPSGNLWATDFGNNRIRQITPAGVVTTIAGNAEGFQDGAGTAASFATPVGLAVDKSGIGWVADWNNNAIRRILPGLAGAFDVTTVAGGVEGLADGLGTAAHFRQPHGVAVAADGSIVVVDQLNHALRRVTLDGTVTTIAGTGTKGYKDGAAKQAQFNDPLTVAIDAAGALWVNDRGNARIRKITLDGQVTTVAGGAEPGDADGYGLFARFREMEDIAFDPQGRLIMADSANNKIRMLNPADGSVVTLAGTGGGDYVEGAGTVAQFVSPTGVVVAADGTIYVADAGLRIRVIKPR